MCWISIPAVDILYAADEVDQMLNIEGDRRKAVVKKSSGKEVVLPAPDKQAKALRQTPQQAKMPEVGAVKSVEPDRQPIATSSNAAADCNVVSMTNVVALRSELMLRCQALADADKEIARLKGIIVRIRDANRRESLVLHYNMAAVYRAGKMYKKAEEEYLKAIAIDPSDAAVRYNLAILYDDNLKDKTKAKRQYEEFLDLAPDDADAPKVREWLSSIL